MTLNDLRYVVAVADHRHFGRAASACFVSQPTLSTQVRKLEDYLGVRLFERTNRSVEITPRGAAIIEHARRVLDEVAQIRALAEGNREPLVGPLRVGIIPTLCPYLLPWVLPPLHAAYPRLEPVVTEDLTASLIERLHAHRLDAAILALPVADDDLCAVGLFDEPFMVACPPDHPLARAEAIGMKDLRRESILYVAEGHCLRDQTLAICGTRGGGTDGDDFSGAGLETIRRLVAAGMGFTLMPVLAVRHDGAPQAGDVVCRLFAGYASRRIGLVHRRSYPREEDMRLLAETIAANIPPEVTPVD